MSQYGPSQPQQWWQAPDGRWYPVPLDQPRPTPIQPYNSPQPGQPAPGYPYPMQQPYYPPQVKENI